MYLNHQQEQSKRSIIIYHIASTEVSSFGFGKIPDNSTISSNDHHSKLKQFMENKIRNENTVLVLC